MSPEDRIKDELLELKMRYEMDELTEKEYKQKEAELKERIKALQEEKGGPE